MPLFGPPNLGKLKNKRDIEGLIKALTYNAKSTAEADKDVRSTAASILGRMGDHRAVEPLIATLQDRAHYVRSTAAQALGQLGDGRAAKPLIAALGDQIDYVQAHAADSLEKLGKEQVGELLFEALQDGNIHVRTWVAIVLGRLGDVRAVEPLITVLQNMDSFTQKRAAGILGKLGDDRAVEPLRAALQDKDGDVRKAAAEALQKLGVPAQPEPVSARPPAEISSTPEVKVPSLTHSQRTAVVLSKLNLYTEYGKPWGWPTDDWQTFFLPECQFEWVGDEIKLTFPGDLWVTLNRFNRSALDEVFGWVTNNIGNPGLELAAKVRSVLEPYAQRPRQVPPSAYEEIGRL